MTILILGRQPALGLAELERLFGAEKVQKIGLEAALVNIPADTVIKANLGGSIKIAELLDEQPTTDWRSLIKFCTKVLPEHISRFPDGKIKLGLSVYEIKVSVNDINKAGLILKKTIKGLGRSVRVVPNAAPALNSAQTLHNQLTSPVGLELVFVKNGDSTLIGQVKHVQNIESYTLRDRGRPKRDTFVGMLPPKLAQIMINLAVNPLSVVSNQLSVKEPQATENRKQKTVLDPFCGTGVILQEAALMGYEVYGTDLSERMVEYSEANLQWLRRTFDVHFDSTLHAADAQNATWQQPIDAVACETYLGKPLHGLPAPADLQNIMRECDEISRNFLSNIASQLKTGTPLCVAIPAWWKGSKYNHLTVVDELNSLGYNRLSFEHARNEELIYRRPDQIVARELLVLIRK
jgi:tRNA (guanine10-N2)-dimethyltransferase